MNLQDAVQYVAYAINHIADAWDDDSVTPRKYCKDCDKTRNQATNQANRLANMAMSTMSILLFLGIAMGQMFPLLIFGIPLNSRSSTPLLEAVQVV